MTALRTLARPLRGRETCSDDVSLGILLSGLFRLWDAEQGSAAAEPSRLRPRSVALAEAADADYRSVGGVASRVEGRVAKQR